MVCLRLYHDHNHNLSNYNQVSAPSGAQIVTGNISDLPCTTTDVSYLPAGLVGSGTSSCPSPMLPLLLWGPSDLWVWGMCGALFRPHPVYCAASAGHITCLEVEISDSPHIPELPPALTSMDELAPVPVINHPVMQTLSLTLSIIVDDM